VTQNPSGVQFDVYFNFSETNPWLTSIHCPLGMTTGCFLQGDPNTSKELTANHKLLPGILRAYRVSKANLGNSVQD